MNNKKIKNMKTKKAQVATGMFIFVSTIIIIFIFLVFNILITLKASTVNQEIITEHQISKAHQTLTAFTRIPGIERVIYKKEDGCKDLEDFALKYIKPAYPGKSWLLTLRDKEELDLAESYLCIIHSDSGIIEKIKHRITAAEVFSEQRYPLPMGKDAGFLILKLEDYD